MDCAVWGVAGVVKEVDLVRGRAVEATLCVLVDSREELESFFEVVGRRVEEAGEVTRLDPPEVLGR